MTEVQGWTFRIRRYALVGVLLASAVAPRAQAETVLSGSSLIAGQQSLSLDFSVGRAGTLKLQVSDLGVPMSIVDRLSALSFGIGSRTTGVLQTLASAGDFSLDIAEPGAYFLFIAALPAQRYQLGLVSWNATLDAAETVVPLPASQWLLLAGLITATGLARIQTLKSARGISDAADAELPAVTV